MVQEGIKNVQERGSYRWEDTVKDVQRRLDETGIPYQAGDPPSAKDTMLPDLSTIDDVRTLEQLLSKYAGWVQYISAQLAEAESRRAAVLNGLDVAVNSIVAQEQKKVGRSETKDAIRARVILSQPALREAQIEYIRVDALVIALKHVLNGFDRSYFAVNRVISTRLAEQGLGDKNP